MFLVLESGGVKCTVVAENKPARILVMIPQDIAPDAYSAEVRTKRFGNGTADSTAHGAVLEAA